MLVLKFADQVFSLIHEHDKIVLFKENSIGTKLLCYSFFKAPVLCRLFQIVFLIYCNSLHVTVIKSIFA
jgi:hypothetical protein